jgi:predicted enzyme related to lactoylglutathione lyase
VPPTFGNGKLGYIEIPATGMARSSGFYQRVFGWNILTNRAGRISFDDGVGEVSGAWVLDRPPATAPGLTIHVMVDKVAATIGLVVANGGENVQPIGADAPEISARFRDPAGNLIGLYQHPRQDH